MTSDERAFLNAICECPEDDTARLVYADWLADHGDSDRGEFIRVQVELDRTPPLTEKDERRRKVLLDRHDELLKKYKSAWLAPFMPFAKESSFLRGFVQALEVPASTFLQHAEKWFSLTPLTRIKITSSHMWDPLTASRTWWIEPLFASPLISRLESFDLECQPLTATALESLTSHADLPRLRELLLPGCDLRSEGATTLANMRQLRHLESLDVRGNGITERGARAIAQSPHFGRLKELRISRNPFRERSWRMLEDRFGDALLA
jgi:uncharacterized protein (TIGR02996 family)